MRAIPPVLLLSGAVLLGILLGIHYLKRVRGKPVMIGFHLLLGAGAVESIAMLIRGAPDGTATPAVAILKVVAGLLAFALFSGLLTPMIGRGSRPRMNVALTIHVAAGSAGFLLCLWWLARALKAAHAA